MRAGIAAVVEPEAVARFIAENISAMNISSNAADVQEDSLRGVLTRPGSMKQVTAPASGTERSRASLQAPSLYDTSGSINSVSLAWQEWTSGPAHSTIAQRVLVIKAHKHMSLGRRNTHLHKKNRHLPQLIESLVGAGASAAQAINLMTHIAQQLQLSLDQVREGSRLLAGKTAKSDSDSLIAESSVTLGDFKAAVGWAFAQVALLQALSMSNMILYMNKINAILLIVWDLLMHNKEMHHYCFHNQWLPCLLQMDSRQALQNLAQTGPSKELHFCALWLLVALTFAQPSQSANSSAYKKNGLTKNKDQRLEFENKTHNEGC